MPTEAKRETVKVLREALDQNQTRIVSSYRGLKVSEIGEIRRSLRKSDVTLTVAKNRLMKIAAQEAGVDELVPLLQGSTAIAFGDDPGRTAKALLDAMRPYSKIVAVRGGVVGTRAFDADGVQRLSALPSREVLLAQLAGGMQAPIAMLGGLLGANLRNLGYALAQVRDAKSAAA
jgi:large subunit ribosomal protein L10